MNKAGRKSGGNRWANVTAAERFYAKTAGVLILGEGFSDCWAWIGGKNNKGYGIFTFNGRKTTAHRAAYELFVGDIPEGLQVDHLCGHPWCVNPSHLEPVTARENLLRGNGWSGRNARKTHCPQGHAYTDENTSVRKGQRHCRACHRERERARKLLKRYAHLDVEDARVDLSLLELRV